MKQIDRQETGLFGTGHALERDSLRAVNSPNNHDGGCRCHTDGSRHSCGRHQPSILGLIRVPKKEKNFCARVEHQIAHAGGKRHTAIDQMDADLRPGRWRIFDVTVLRGAKANPCIFDRGLILNGRL